MIKRAVRRLVSILVLLLLTAAGIDAQTAVIREVTGKVELLKPGAGWVKAVKGMTVDKGATISTGFKSSAVLELGSSIVTARALTRLTLEELVRIENTVQTSLFLKVGKVRAEVKSSQGLAQDFKLKSPVSTAAVRGTTIEGDGENTTCEGGLVSVSNALGQTRTIGDGEQTTVASADAPPAAPEAQKAADAGVATGPIVVTGGPAPTITPAPTIFSATFMTSGTVQGVISTSGSIEAMLDYPYNP